MSMAIIALNTETRECVLTMDGIPVSVDSVYFNKYTDYNGDKYISFGYSITQKNNQGMEEVVQYILPRPDQEDMHEYSMEKNGLASRIIDKAKAISKDIGKFLNIAK